MSSDKETLNTRRVSISANNRISALSVGEEMSGSTTGTLGNTMVASRKMSAVDSTARASIMRNKVDSTNLPEETTEAELKGYEGCPRYRG